MNFVKFGGKTEAARKDLEQFFKDIFTISSVGSTLGRNVLNQLRRQYKVPLGYKHEKASQGGSEDGECQRRKSTEKKKREKLGKIYEKILALFEMPEIPLPTGKRGRLKHTEAQNLWRRLDDYKDSVLLFTKVAEVEATNNRAERDLRMNKVKKKVSGCFRSEEMAQHFCLIYSYVKTMRNKGFSSLQAITLAFKGQIPN